jgi:hypothetical protein
MIRDWVKQIRAYLEPNFHVTRLKEFRSAENLYQGPFDARFADRLATTSQKKPASLLARGGRLVPKLIV